MWTYVIDYLSGNSAPYLFCGTILVVFFHGLIDGWARLAAVQSAVTRGIGILQHAPDRQAFFEQFESLHDQFVKQPLFANSWSEFSKTVILDGTRQLVRITRRPEGFFNERSLIASRLNLRLFAAMPGYLISLGLFFTFIGLVAAI